MDTVKKSFDIDWVANVIIIAGSAYTMLCIGLFPEIDTFIRGAMRKGIFKAFNIVWDKIYFFYLTNKIKNIDVARPEDRIKHFEKYFGKGVVSCPYKNCAYFGECPHKSKAKIVGNNGIYFTYKIKDCKYNKEFSYNRDVLRTIIYKVDYK
jgi:hypothetical protein